VIGKPFAAAGIAAALCGCGRLHFDALGDAVDAAAGPRVFAYVINYDNPIGSPGETKIAILAFDPTTGMMVEQPVFDLGVTPTALAPSRDGKLLFVGSRVAGSIYTLRIDPLTGALTQYATVSPTAAWPFSMTIHPSGNFLYTAAENVAASVWGYAIAGDGTLTPIAGTPWSYGGTTSNFVAIDPSGAWLYAVDDTHSLYGYAVQADGSLVVQPSLVWDSGDINPHATVFTPSGRYGFVAPDMTGGIPGCTLDVATGTLTTTPGSEFASGASVSEFEALSPAGDLLFMPVEATTLAVYAIAGDGSVAHVPNSPLTTPNGTIGVAASPAGGYAVYTDGTRAISVRASTAGVSLVQILPLTTIAEPNQIVMTQTP
jgi:6-phosphogluconolactonase (cycloisomerase 2 family)